MEIGAIILAAGFGRRFGGDKRLAVLNGKSVAQTTVKTYASVFSQVRVVLRTEDHVLAQRLISDAELVVTDQAHLGMGHSLAAGIRGVNWNWAFVGLADMPYVQAKSLRRLIQVALTSERRVLRPRLLQDTRQSTPQPPHGHPIGFHQTLFPDLAALTGDQGARNLLKARPGDIQDIELEDPGIVRDIDHRTDLLS